MIDSVPEKKKKERHGIGMWWMPVQGRRGSERASSYNNTLP